MSVLLPWGPKWACEIGVIGRSIPAEGRVAARCRCVVPGAPAAVQTPDRTHRVVPPPPDPEIPLAPAEIGQKLPSDSRAPPTRLSSAPAIRDYLIARFDASIGLPLAVERAKPAGRQAGRADAKSEKVDHWAAALSGLRERGSGGQNFASTLPFRIPETQTSSSEQRRAAASGRGKRENRAGAIEPSSSIQERCLPDALSPSLAHFSSARGRSSELASASPLRHHPPQLAPSPSSIQAPSPSNTIQPRAGPLVAATHPPHPQANTCSQPDHAIAPSIIPRLPSSLTSPAQRPEHLAGWATADSAAALSPPPPLPV
ncbi:hypothetical protein L1887_58264 [Cichorium endivia]|nr:hypothetical protein L1887_58264 [Cichorium endivia]